MLYVKTIITFSACYPADRLHTKRRVCLCKSIASESDDPTLTHVAGTNENITNLSRLSICMLSLRRSNKSPLSRPRVSSETHHPYTALTSEKFVIINPNNQKPTSSSTIWKLAPIPVVIPVLNSTASLSITEAQLPAAKTPRTLVSW